MKNCNKDARQGSKIDVKRGKDRGRPVFKDTRKEGQIKLKFDIRFVKRTLYFATLASLGHIANA